MTTDSNKPGPTTLWKTIKGKDVKTNDGKELGEIKDISDNYIRVEKGKIQRVSGFQSTLPMHMMVKLCGFW